MNGIATWFDNPHHFLILFFTAWVVLAALGMRSRAKYAMAAAKNPQSILGFVGAFFRRPGDRAFLQSQGWSYQKRATIQWPGRFSLPPLASPSLAVKDLASGNLDGSRCTAFTVVGGTSGWASVEMIEMSVVLPTLTIEPVLLDPSKGIWLHATPFESESVDFNERWRVQSADPRFASAVLSPRVMARLMEGDLADVMIGIDGGALVNLFPGPIPDDRVLPHFALLRELLHLIPQGILNDFGTPRPDADGATWNAPAPPGPATP